ncbi:MAG: ethanolamine utilization protein EutJ [Modestobacter sp.]|jgi:branched-chain amino acid transport system substrate-binding protein|nr:ethanolamine utilization protein EutJ [Modestobacter sp.]MCW2620348.1 ethanolamine utilization protein EutJ [Modestobacter sp.]
MSPKRRWVLATSVVSVVGVALSGCGGGEERSSSAGQQGDYVIGIDDVLSGPLAGYGQSFLTSARAAVEYVNDNGGVNGRNVRLETADSAAAGQNASAAAQQLINAKGAMAILGFTLSDDCAAVSAVAESRKVPIVCTSTPAAQLAPVKDYVFASNDVEVQEIPGMVAFAQETLGFGPGTRFAIVDTSPTGVQLWAEGLTKALEKEGFELTTHQTIPVTAVNGSTQISEVVSSNPDIIFAEPVASQYQPLVQALRAAGNDAPIVAAHNGANYGGLSTIKDAGLYNATATEFVVDAAPEGEGAKMYADAMAAIGEGSPAQMNGVIGAPGFLATYGVIKALENCADECTGEKLASAMEKVSIPMPGLVSGNYGWTAELHQPYHEYFFYHWDDAAQQPVIAQSGVPYDNLSQ